MNKATVPVLYVLRTSQRTAERFYLAGLYEAGLRANFSPKLEDARTFTRAQRVAFEKRASHVRGRWVILDKERARRRAAEVQP